MVQVCHATDANILKTADELIKIVAVDEQKIRQDIPVWDEFKNRDYSLQEYGLLENDKSRLFIKVFMAKIKYIKRNVQNPQINLNLPLNPLTQKIDEKQLIENTKLEILNLLGFYESDILPASSTKVTLFNPNK
jgi:hypothetical protein